MSMSAAQARRQAVAQALEEAVGPVSAAALAERFSVSRQIIVGDVAAGGGARSPSALSIDRRNPPAHGSLPG